MMTRHYSFLDKLCLQFDQGLKVLTNNVKTTARNNPADRINAVELNEKQQSHAAALMRVNHVGEVCAQALYQGQALTARDAAIRMEMQQAAMEENDHLAWCTQRLTELYSRTSYLNPLWYSGSFAIGAIAGLFGDRWSLGFVVETETQVEAHLVSHLEKLPQDDAKSRAIVAQMKLDEAKHAEMAKNQGAVAIPTWIKATMRFKAKLMTTISYWI